MTRRRAGTKVLPYALDMAAASAYFPALPPPVAPETE
jgi:hypothetical protein